MMAARARNAANPRIGSRVQQTCNLRAEETVEVVRNHADGTWLEAATSSSKYDGDIVWEWTLGRNVDGGAYRWPVRKHAPRRIPREEVGFTGPGECGALKESQVHEGRAACRHDDTRNTSKAVR